MLLVACLGADTLVGYDIAAPSPVDAEVLRTPVAAGPTGIALDPGHARALVWSQFERALNIVTWDRAGAELSTELHDPERIELAPVQGTELSAELALGRRLFFATQDPRIASDGRACASCHLSGRDDGLTWSTPHGPRRTKMLAGLLSETAPYAWDGNAKDVEAQVRHTFARLQGQGGLRSADLRALVSYVQALPAPHTGYAKERAELVERGAQVFASAEVGCVECHDSRATTDGERHDVMSNVTADASDQFDTPSLRFLSGRAPYFHDGRYADLQALLQGCDGTMGHTKQLSTGDFSALKAYLEVL
jgi:cytochrome c peroxidase